MLNDIRYAIRFVSKMFRQEFGLTVITVLTLALAIGTNTAIFGVVNALLFKAPAGIDKPGELLTLSRTSRGRFGGSVSYPNYIHYRNQNEVFSAVAAFSNGIRSFGLQTPAGAEQVPALLVSGNYFDVLGIKPHIGRFFSLADEQAGGPGMAVVSHRLWASRFGGDAGLAGKSIVLNGNQVPVAGVTPEGFHGADIRSIDIWIPVSSNLTDSAAFLKQSAGWLTVVARLKPAVTRQQAQAKLDLVSQQLAEAEPDTNRNVGVVALPLRLFPAGTRAPLQAFLSVLMAAATLVLVIACANIAGIGLARATARKREIAVRLALGASRSRVIRQLVIETSALFAIAAGVGVIMAQWLEVLLDHLRLQVPFPIAPVIDVTTDFRVVVFTVAVTALAALISGLTPALHGTYTDVSTAMKDDSIAATYRRSRLRGGLVIVQVALSFVLLFGGGLFLRTLMRIADADLGFDPSDVQIASLDFTLGGIPQAEGEQLERDLLDRVSSLRGIESASFALDLPMDLNAVGLGGISVIGHEPPRGLPAFPALWNVVSPGYFKTLKIPLLRGRDFNETDRESSRAVAIINETMAAQFWSGQDAVGQIFYRRGPIEEGRPVQVIGVAKNVNTRGINEELAPFIYVPYAQDYRSEHQLVMRTVPGTDVFPTVRRLVRETNPNLPIITFRSMDEVVGFGLLPQRLAAWVAGVMGLVGALLAALGIYGVTSFAVSSRTREIGIRVALGAEPGRVLTLIVREGMVLAAAGFGLGSVAALGMAQMIRAFIYVSPTDAVTFGAAALAMAATALLASYLPGRRAIKVDPMVALRHE